MRAFGFACVVVGYVMTSTSCFAAQHIGTWFVEIEKDPFSTKKKSIATLPADKGGAFLAIRCFPDSGLSAVLMMLGKDYDTGAKVGFKYRADQGEIADEVGQAFSEKLIELPNPNIYFADAGKASSLYFRVETSTNAITDLEFKPRGSVKALAQIKADCPPPPAEEKKSEGPTDKMNRLLAAPEEKRTPLERLQEFQTNAHIKDISGD